MEMETLCAVLNGGTVSLGVMSLAKFCTTFYEFHGGGERGGDTKNGISRAITIVV